MKKVLLSLAIIAITGLSVSAQTSDDSQIKLDVGVKAGLPIGDFSNVSSVGFGGFLKAAYPASSDFDVTLTAGYTSFSGKSIDGFSYPSLGLFDVLAGGSYKVDESFHIDGGIGFGTFSSGGGSGFAYRVGVGYKFATDFDVTANYNGISSGGSLSYIGIGLSYNFVK